MRFRPGGGLRTPQAYRGPSHAIPRSAPLHCWPFSAGDGLIHRQNITTIKSWLYKNFTTKGRSEKYLTPISPSQESVWIRLDRGLTLAIRSTSKKNSMKTAFEWYKTALEFSCGTIKVKNMPVCKFLRGYGTCMLFLFARTMLLIEIVAVSWCLQKRALLYIQWIECYDGGWKGEWIGYIGMRGKVEINNLFWKFIIISIHLLLPPCGHYSIDILMI